ncbi:MAG: hypothetical protein ACERIG_08075 [Hyphomicrobium sp.]
MKYPELSYANVPDRPLRRGVIGLLEHLSGRDYFAPYDARSAS